MEQRAYSILHVKAVDAERRVITGTASTPNPDRIGDIVEPLGASFTNPLPLLLFHDSTRPVGTVKLDKATKDGIGFTASLPDIQEPGPLRDRVQEAWLSIKEGLIRGVSIGFRTLEDGIERMKDGGLRFTDYEVLELSLVPIPANSDATILSIKSFDAAHLAASGTAPGTSRHTSGASDARVVSLTQSTRGVAMSQSIQERKIAFQAEKAAKVAKMNELMAGEDAGATLDTEHQEQFDTLGAEIKSLDAHLGRLETLEAVNKATAVAVDGGSAAHGSASRGGAPVITVTDNLPPGIGFARYVISKVAARLEGTTALDIAKQRWPGHSELHNVFQRAAVPAATTTESVWLGPLYTSYANSLSVEFLEFLRPRTIVGRIPNLRRVPFGVRFTSQTSGASANWVGQGKGKPVTSFGTTANTLAQTKIAAIAVITEELARFSSPSAETMVRDELARAVIERMDIDFIDPAQAAVANVNPASVTNGVVPLSSAGVSEANIRTDLTNLLSTFVENNVDPTNLVLIMPNTLALAAQLMVNSLGQPSFPGIAVNGGTLVGIPVITSQYAANASGSGNLVIALNASDIFLADDGQVTVDASREASIQMSDAPTVDATSGTGASLVSMYQTNSIAIRAERYINWVKGRSTAVVFMDDVNWGSVGSPA